MKKRRKLILIFSIVLAVILFVPWPIVSKIEDGGTKMYFALAYKVVDWKPWCSTVYGDSIQYRATRIYWFPDNFKSYDELLAIEQARDDFPSYIR